MESINLQDGITHCEAENADQYQEVATPYYAPALQLPTNRSCLKIILLGLITFGIYDIVIWSKIASEINITASRYDGKRTCPYMAMVWLTMITYGVFALVWMHKFSERVGAEVKRRGYDYSFGSADFWLWNVLGSLILIGPIVYCHKLMKSVNMINESYNVYG